MHADLGVPSGNAAPEHVPEVLECDEDTCFACSEWMKTDGVTRTVPVRIIAKQIKNMEFAFDVLAKIMGSMNEHDRMARLVILRADFSKIFADDQPQAANASGHSPGTAESGAGLTSSSEPQTGQPSS